MRNDVFLKQPPDGSLNSTGSEMVTLQERARGDICGFSFFANVHQYLFLFRWQLKEKGTIGKTLLGDNLPDSIVYGF